MTKTYQFFKETINRTIQNSGLDIGAAYFILKDIFRDVETLYYSQINKELLEESKQENAAGDTCGEPETDETSN